MLCVLHFSDLLLRQHITTLKPTVIIHFNDLVVGVLRQNQNPLLRFISNIPESKKQPSFTVDYLVNKCGVPPEKAFSAAKMIPIFTVEKADSVISLFQSYGLTQPHITKLISHRPELLSFDPNKTLKPKFEYLRDYGISGPDIANLIASDTTLLARSLQNHIIPSFNILKSYIVTTADIPRVFKRCPRFIEYNLEKTLIPNMSILKGHGVPDCNISKLLISQPTTLMYNTDRFKKIVERVKNIGFEPSSPMFFHAVRTMAGVSKLSWEKKAAIYNEFGLSEDDILTLFKKQPFVMMASEDKIRKALEFFMKKLKWQTAEILSRPALLLLSMEKRIIPRCAVLEVLKSNRTGVKKYSVGSILKMSERDFLKKFVIEYQEKVPEVTKAHKGEIEFTGFKNYRI